MTTVHPGRELAGIIGHTGVVWLVTVLGLAAAGFRLREYRVVPNGGVFCPPLKQWMPSRPSTSWI